MSYIIKCVPTSKYKKPPLCNQRFKKVCYLVFLLLNIKKLCSRALLV